MEELKSKYTYDQAVQIINYPHGLPYADVMYACVAIMKRAVDIIEKLETAKEVNNEKD